MDLLPFLAAVCLSLPSVRMQEWLLSKPEFKDMPDAVSVLPENIRNELEVIKKNEKNLTEGDGLVLDEELENPLSDPKSLSELDNAVPEELLAKSQDGGFTFFSYGEELLDSIKLTQGNALVTVNKDIFTQRIYDESNRLVEKAVWKNTVKNNDDDGLIRKILYQYTDRTPEQMDYSETGKPLYPPYYVSLTVTEDFVQKTLAEVYTDNRELVTERKIYAVGEKKNNLVKKISYYYDAQKNITRLSSVTYKDDAVVLSSETSYVYSKENVLVSEKYSENNVLRSFTEYPSENEKNITYYFDDGYEVYAHYVDDVKVSESFKVPARENNP